MFKKIMNEVKDANDDEDGGFNAGNQWKLKKKILQTAVIPQQPC